MDNTENQDQAGSGELRGDHGQPTIGVDPGRTDETVIRDFKRKPSIGRTVHFWITSSGLLEPRAAVITAVRSDDEVSLTILHPKRMEQLLEATWSNEPREGHWSWPQLSH